MPTSHYLFSAAVRLQLRRSRLQRLTVSNALFKVSLCDPRGGVTPDPNLPTHEGHDAGNFCIPYVTCLACVDCRFRGGPWPPVAKLKINPPALFGQPTFVGATV